MTFLEEREIKSDLDRLSYDPDRDRTGLFGQWFWPMGITLGLLSLHAGHNIGYKKPIQTAAWRLAIIIPAGIAFGSWLDKYQREKSRVQWAKIKQYVELHPEDFPPYPRRVKFSETISPWIPQRPGW